MENKINIAEILKDCPSGMELDCTMYNGVVKFEQVIDSDAYPIKIRVKYGNKYLKHALSEYGQTYKSIYNKCVIFPKGKTTWEGFQRPFKDGDVVVSKSESWIGIVRSYNYWDKTYDVYVAFENWKGNYINIHVDIKLEFSRLATEEEKEKFFKAIKANGYHWNDETKTLEILIKPKFKIGDRIRHKLTGKVYKVSSFLSNGYGSGVYEIGIKNELVVKIIDIKEQDNYELLPNKFDITTLKPFDKVLVRDENGQKWMCDIFSYYDDKNPRYPFLGVGRSNSKQCIPYKGNEHLLGTTNDCDEFYKNWQE